MPARKRTAEAKRAHRRWVRTRAEEIRLARRPVQEEASAWSEHEYYTRPDPVEEDVPYVLPWDAVEIRAREVLGPPPPSPRVWARLVEP